MLYDLIYDSVNGVQGVAGSNPVVPTTTDKGFLRLREPFFIQNSPHKTVQGVVPLKISGIIPTNLPFKTE